MELRDFIRREIEKDGGYSSYQIFKGLENSHTLKKLIKKKPERIAFLKRQKIKFDSRAKWPNVLNPDHITFPYSYLKDESPAENYLDILHELTHCFQREKEHIDFKKQIRQFEYHENPKELEAYALGWIQAQKVGMKRKDFIRYLYGDGFLSRKEKALLVKNVFKFKLG